MQKVKLVFCKSYVDIPTFKDSFSKDIEVELPEGMEQAHLIGARVYWKPTKEPTVGSDINTTILEYRDDSNLLGQLLTYVDATYTDQEQRKAHKDIVKQIVYGWSQELRTRGIQTVDSHTKEVK